MKFAAHYILTGSGAPIAKGIVEVDAQGTILQITSQPEGFREQAGMEFHSGLICPTLPDLLRTQHLDELFEQIPRLIPYKEQVPANRLSPKANFEWLKAIQLNHPIALAELIELFCQQAASQTGEAGANIIAPGKRPGLSLISVINYAELRLTAESRIRKLI